MYVCTTHRQYLYSLATTSLIKTSASISPPFTFIFDSVTQLSLAL